MATISPVGVGLLTEHATFFSFKRFPNLERVIISTSQKIDLEKLQGLVQPFFPRSYIDVIPSEDL